MSFIGLELNTTWARAVHGPAAEPARELPLEPPRLELPLMVIRQGRRPRAGQAALKQCREQPHRVWQHFLPALGLSAAAAASLGRFAHPDEALQATVAILEHLAQHCNSGQQLVLALPAYLEAEQLKLLRTLAKQSGLAVLGSLPTSLAAALAAYARRPWFGPALVLDIDDHALMLSRVDVTADRLLLASHTSIMALGLKCWKDRLLKALADCCIRQSRRDPRASPQAEQTLYENLEAVMDASRQGRTVQLGLQASQWYQNLLVCHEQTPVFCQQLVRQTLSSLQGMWQASQAEGPPRRLLLTAAAARLPGLTGALDELLRTWPAPQPELPQPAAEDFGADLLTAELAGARGLEELTVTAVARASHALAAPWQAGTIRPGHLTQAPLSLQLTV